MRRARLILILAAVLLTGLLAYILTSPDGTTEMSTAAARYAAQGEELLDRGDYLAAADAFNTAAEIALDVSNEERGRYLFRYGHVFHLAGEDRGNRIMLALAVDAYRSALELVTQADAPRDWATIQMNLGGALVSLGMRDRDPQTLRESIAASRAALEALTRRRAPLDWGRIQVNLGGAVVGLAHQDGDAARAAEAVATYRAALEELTRDRAPLDWAQAQWGLGFALVALDQLEDGPTHLDAALAAFQAALEERTRDRVPTEWARTQIGLAAVLIGLGERDDSTRRFEAAVEASRNALEELTAERAPSYWASAQMSLGLALEALGTQERSVERLEGAVAAYRAALEGFERIGATHGVGLASENLRIAEYQLRDLQAGPALPALAQLVSERDAQGDVDEAAARGEMLFARGDYLEAGAAFSMAARLTPDSAPNQRGAYLLRYGQSLHRHGEAVGNRLSLSMAVGTYRHALAELTMDRAPVEWAATQLHLGMALMALAERERGPVRLQEAVAAFHAALEAAELAEDRSLVRSVAENLRAAERELNDRQADR